MQELDKGIWHRLMTSRLKSNIHNIEPVKSVGAVVILWRCYLSCRIGKKHVYYDSVNLDEVVGGSKAVYNVLESGSTVFSIQRT